MFNAQKIKIEGMTCQHCAMSVERAIEDVPGVKKVKVKLKANIAEVKGEFDIGEISKAVESAGYKVVN